MQTTPRSQHQPRSKRRHVRILYRCCVSRRYCVASPCLASVQASAAEATSITIPHVPFRQVLSRRDILELTASTLLTTGSRQAQATEHEVAAEISAELYRSSTGYQIQKPAAWSSKQKAGAEVLFSDPEKASTTVGVTVSPVRIASLTAFGSSDDVAAKLLAAEKKKESTISVELLQTETRSLSTGEDAYAYEYELNSTRGRKRVLNVVTISQSKLYIVNAQCKCTEDGCPGSTIQQLRQIAASFDLSRA
eukprot:jgi/Ulvmu1/4327/UM002_0050.1